MAVPSVFADTLTVCPSGCNYTTIIHAVGNASSGDVIEVGAGTYTGDIEVNKSLAIEGANRTTCIVSISVNHTNGFTIIHDDVNISGLTIQKSPAGAEGGTGIYCNGTDRCIIDDCIIKDWGSFGVRMDSSIDSQVKNSLFDNIILSSVEFCNSTDPIITDNIFTNVHDARGIMLQPLNWSDQLGYGTGGIISRNVIDSGEGGITNVNEEAIISHNIISGTGNAGAISCYAPNCIIESNVLSSPADGSGISLVESGAIIQPNNCIVRNNIISGFEYESPVGTAIAVMGSAVKPIDNVIIENNTCSVNRNGIVLWDSVSNTVVKNNLIHTATTGMWIENNLTNVTVFNNEITNCSVALGIDDYDVECTGIYINFNYIHDNIYDVKADYRVLSYSVDCVNNWWGTINSTVINESLLGDVDFVPFLTGAIVDGELEEATAGDTVTNDDAGIEVDLDDATGSGTVMTADYSGVPYTETTLAVAVGDTGIRYIDVYVSGFSGDIKITMNYDEGDIPYGIDEIMFELYMWYDDDWHLGSSRGRDTNANLVWATFPANKFTGSPIVIGGTGQPVGQAFPLLYILPLLMVILVLANIVRLGVTKKLTFDALFKMFILIVFVVVLTASLVGLLG